MSDDTETAIMLGGPRDGATVEIATGPAPVRYAAFPHWQSVVRYRRTGERDESGRAIFRFYDESPPEAA